MAFLETQIREVVDAGYDHFGSQDVSSSIMTGWTTNLLSVMTTYWGSSNASNIYFFNMKDSQNTTPHQDGVALAPVVGNPGAPYRWSLVTPGQTNVGVRHYWQQMQSMKGGWATPGNLPLAGHYDVNSPSRYDTSVGLTTGIEPVRQGNGTYRHSDIHMGRMRGFEYPINTSVFVWPSSAIPPNALAEPPSPGGREYLDNSGQISVGNPTAPVYGCMDPQTTCGNYNPLATIDDGSCCY